MSSKFLAVWFQHSRARLAALWFEQRTKDLGYPAKPKRRAYLNADLPVFKWPKRMPEEVKEVLREEYSRVSDVIAALDIETVEAMVYRYPTEAPGQLSTLIAV